jgi:hypothetical protein
MNVVLGLERHGDGNRSDRGEGASSQTVEREAVGVDIAGDAPPVVGVFVIEDNANGADSVARLDKGEERLVRAGDGGGVEEQKGAACVGALIAGGANVAAFANVARSLAPLACAARRRQGVVDLQPARTGHAVVGVQRE